MGRRRKKQVVSSNRNKLWKIAVYIRLSREDGNDESKSVTHQKDRILTFLSEQFEDDHELVDVYIDDGFTGTDTNRGSFQRMLKDIREHKVNCVIVKDLSRLSRNLADATFHIENTFVEYDIRFISLELPSLDSWKYPEQMNSIAVPMQNVINDDFCRQTSIKVRGTFNNKRSRGEFIGAFAPYGYMKDPDNKHHLIVDEEVAVIIQDIYKWYVREGLSKNGIAKKLNELCIPNPAAYKKLKGLKYNNPNSKRNDSLWGPKTVTEILQNQMYLGHMVQGKYRVKSYKVHTQITTPKEEWFVVENTHKAIISQELFDMAQRLQEKDTRTAPGEKNLYLLSGYVRCPDCGKAMVRSQGGSKIKYSYYQCRTYRDKSKDVCTKHSIRADYLENAVFETIKKQISLVFDLKKSVEKISRLPNTQNKSIHLKSQQTEREKELDKVVTLKDGLYEDWKSGFISKEDYLRLKDKYEEQIERLKDAIDKLKQEQKTMAEDINPDGPYISSFTKYANLKELTRDLVVALINTIHVHESGEVEIVFNYADQFKVIMEYIENNQKAVQQTGDDKVG